MLPNLGTGLVYSPRLHSILESGRNLFDVVEIEPQVFWKRSQKKEQPYIFDEKQLKKICSLPQKKIIHSVSLPVGGLSRPCPRQTEKLAEFTMRVGAHWASEHLSFNRIETPTSFHTGFFLPPIQTSESIESAVQNIHHMQAALSCPFAFETGVNYLQPQAGEIPDGRFFGTIAEKADCGILLDLHNLWCNERNGRQKIDDVILELPLERIWEIHLAGGTVMNDYYLDAHSGLIPDKLFDIAAQIIPTLPNLHALIFEIMEDYIQYYNISDLELLKQGEKLRILWENKGCKANNINENLNKPDLEQYTANIPQKEWEKTLGMLVTGQDPQGHLTKMLLQDNGIPIYQSLIKTIRGGMAISTLMQSTRLIRLTVGEDHFLKILNEFWSTIPPQPFPTDEARNLLKFLRDQSLDIDQLEIILTMEENLLKSNTNSKT